MANCARNLEEVNDRSVSEHRDYWRAIIDAVDQPIIVTNPDGIIVEFNTAAEQLTGYLARDVVETLPLAALYVSRLSATHARVPSSERCERPEPGVATLLAADAQADGEWALRRKDGQRLEVSVACRALGGAQGTSAGCVVLLRELAVAAPARGQVETLSPAALRREPADEAALPEPCFAPSDVLRRLDGDSALLAEVVELFQSERFALATNIQRGVDERDPAAVERGAHRLRSALLNLAAAPAAKAALSLEESGRRGSVPRPQQVALLFAELERLSDALTRFRGKSP